MNIWTKRTPADSKTIRYAIALTYNCNAACKYCNRFLDVFTWKDTDITLEDLETAWKIVSDCGMDLEKVRITGGEPLMHPNYEECIIHIRDTWKQRDTRRMPIFTNGILKGKHIEGCRYRTEPIAPEKIECHTVPMLSPIDLGLKPVRGFESGSKQTYCHRQRSCGRLLDCHGFTFCIFAGVIGRMIGVDPYKPYPVLDGNVDICGHCPFSIGIKKYFQLSNDVKAGKIEYPTKTYRECIERNREQGHIKIRKLQERLCS